MNRIKILAIVLLLSIISPAYAWSNGGYSSSPDSPKYGTHDYILQKAINMLPLDMRNKIDLTAASYGTEIPDCHTGTYCIGDISKHHVYYYVNRTLQDGSSARRSQEEYNLARTYLLTGNKYQFSLHLGAMAHYLSDVAVFGHTMGTGTYWGTETHHSDYETYVENHLSLFPTSSLQGTFMTRSAYDATLLLAKETTFNGGNIYNNRWMDRNYNWTNSTYITRTKNLINFNTGLLADVIYTLVKNTQSITITSPDGGEIWPRGSTKTIRWNRITSSGTNVKIELLKAGTVVRTIASNTHNDGSYSSTVPWMTLGSDYKIKITSTSNSAYTDTSNNNFIIGGINVISPDGGESWQRGTTKTIRWSSLKSPGQNIRIDLYKGETFKQIIKANTPNDGSYSWSILPGLEAGTNYKIKIMSSNNSVYYDWSNDFRIY